jgi:hypothetical protein
MKKQIAVGKLSISKATNDGSLLHSPAALQRGAGGQADAVPCSLPHYNNSIQTQPRGEHPLPSGLCSEKKVKCTKYFPKNY